MSILKSALDSCRAYLVICFLRSCFAWWYFVALHHCFYCCLHAQCCILLRAIPKGSVHKSDEENWGSTAKSRFAWIMANTVCCLGPNNGAYDWIWPATRVNCFVQVCLMLLYVFCFCWCTEYIAACRWCSCCWRKVQLLTRLTRRIAVQCTGLHTWVTSTLFVSLSASAQNLVVEINKYGCITLHLLRHGLYGSASCCKSQ